MRSRLSWTVLGTLIVATSAAAPAHAVLQPLAFYHLGENDPGATTGGTVSTTIESLGITPDKDFVATAAATPLTYSADTIGYTTSTRSIAFNNTEAYLATTATPWYQQGGAFRWGAEMFLKPDPSLQGVASVFFTNGNQFTMGITDQGLFYVNQTGPGTTPVKFGQWQHVAFFTTGSFWQIYVDGVAQFATQPNFNYGAPSGEAVLGGDNVGDITTSYTGLMDEHRIFTWSGAFNPNELLWYQGRRAGDVNQDGAVNSLDYNVWRQNVGADLTGVAALDGRARGDLNGDRLIDLADFGIIKTNKTPGANLIPEPAAATLLLVGVGALALRRKRTARGLRFAALAGLALSVALLEASSASAQATATWSGGDGNWNDAKWSGGSGAGGRPAAGDNVVLPSNTGTVTVSNNIGVVFETMNQQGGILNIQPAGGLEFAGVFENGKGASPTGETSIAGQLTVGNGLNVGYDSPAALTITGAGVLNVTGALDTWWAPGAVFNITGGTQVNVSDTLYVGPAATVNANITSTAFSSVKVANTLSIQGGTLNANFTGFTPALGNTWTLFDAANRGGTLTNVNATGLGPGKRLNVGYTAGGTLGQTVALSVASTLNLKVNAGTGNLTIENPAVGAAALNIDGYIIRSVGNALNAAGFTGVGQAGWLPGVAPSQTNGLISETNFDGTLPVNQGATYSLGSAFNGAGAQDLTFEYRLVSGEILRGTVEYTGSAGFAGDFNGNGRVDGADLTVWKAGFGAQTGATKATGDFDLDGDVDGNDFLGWQRQNGSGAPPAAASAGAVPEPASIVLLGMAALGPIAARRRRLARR